MELFCIYYILDFFVFTCSMNGIKYRAYWKSIFGILEHPTEYYYPPKLYSGTPYWILLPPWTLFWDILLNNITPLNSILRHPTKYNYPLNSILGHPTEYYYPLNSILEHPTEYYYPPELYSGTPYCILLPPWTLFWNTLLNIITSLNSILENSTEYYYPPELYSGTPYRIILPPWTLFCDTLLNSITTWTLFWNTLLIIITPLNSILGHSAEKYYPLNAILEHTADYYYLLNSIIEYRRPVSVLCLVTVSRAS